MNETPINVKQGCIVIDKATILHQSDDFVAVSLELSSKRADLACLLDGHVLCFDKSEDTLHTNDVDVWTEVEFSDFVGWSLWAYSDNKYSFNLCFRKGINDEYV